MKIATQITLLILAIIFSLDTMAYKNKHGAYLSAGAAAGSFILLLLSLTIQ